MKLNASTSLLNLTFIALSFALSACQAPKKKSDAPTPSIVAEKTDQHLLEKTLYLRGGFNGWGSDHPFRHVDGSTYESMIKIAPGNHEFKIATIDWKSEWVISGDKSTPLSLGQTYVLKKGGAGSFLFVKKTGNYLFRFNNSDPTAPKLTISWRPAQKSTQVKPHVGKRDEVLVEFTTWDNKKEEVQISIPFPDKKFRDYTHSTSQSLRDPDPQYVRYSEVKNHPRVRSGSLQFDALFALALHEMRLNSVGQIRDGNYQQGQPIDCDCFETGAKWHYVWTRDLAYAADLGLSILDPQRVRNSLEFKLSGFRKALQLSASLAPHAAAEQIVQDTGTGGSWPVSTDRVAWAFGAASALEYLKGDERIRFARRALDALKTTVEIDRVAAFDSNDGLYSGEQSFLDWREQSYAAWTVDDIARLASAKALSTNVAHYKALSLLADLSNEFGQPSDHQKYSAWAAALRRAINQKFWQEEKGSFSSLTASHFDGRALEKYDLLGTALAVTTNVADGERARKALSNYPHGPMGAPVIFPQQIDVPVYHNRAIWPFVTAYALKAAKHVAHTQVADAAYNTLIRSASLNLSNMENLEWLSGQPMLLDETTPRLSGPVINSKRQLWSVGGYLGMVIESVFGVSQKNDAINVAPFITSGLRRNFFADSRSIALLDLELLGTLVDIRIFLPSTSKVPGHYPVKSILLNGAEVGNTIPKKLLRKANTLVIRLGPLIEDTLKVRKVEGSPYASQDPHLFAPLAPVIKGNSNTPVSVQVVDADKDLRNYSLYKNSKETATGSDPRRLAEQVNLDGRSCYAVSATYPVSGNRSHHSRPFCAGESIDIWVDDKRITSNKKVQALAPGFDGPLIKNWGQPRDSFEVKDIPIQHAGSYALRLHYFNHYNEINLGITNGVKWLVLYDKNSREVGRAVLQMPHVQSAENKREWSLSTPLVVSLKQGVYRAVLKDYFNMSYLVSNESFTGNGGSEGPINRFDIGGLNVLALP